MGTHSIEPRTVPHKLSPPGTAAGDQKRDEFLRYLHEVWETLLVLPKKSDTTTLTETSRNAATVTADATVASRIAALGSGVSVDFDGTDDEADTPDAARLSFGDGAADSPFSLMALIKPDVNDANDVIIAKENSATAEEWRLELTSSGHPQLVLSDESATASIGRRDATAIGTDWVLLQATYDGSRSAVGIRVYVNAARVDDTDASAGTYVAMENTAALVHFASRYTTKALFFDGRVALWAISPTQVSVERLWADKAAINAFFDLSL